MKKKTGVELIAEERQRQINEERWSAEHDKNHINGELAKAAVCYALPINIRPPYGEPPPFWPWDDASWKPSDKFMSLIGNGRHERIRELQKAGALIAAEIDRLQNLEE